MDYLANYFILFASMCYKDAWSINLDHESLKEVAVESRLLRGEETTIEEHPYQAFLRASDFRVGCSGAIVSSHHIVTSALCVDKADEIKIRVGSTHKLENGQEYTTKIYMIHPMYLAGENDFDVAIVVIQDGMELDEKTVDTIDLVPLNNDPATGKKMIVSGWGDWGTDSSYQYTHTLEEVDLYAINTRECAEDKPEITDRLFCLIDKGDKHHTCKGDLGDPVVDENGLLAGVISVYIVCSDNELQPVTRFGEPQIRSFIMATTTSIL